MAPGQLSLLLALLVLGLPSCVLAAEVLPSPPPSSHPPIVILSDAQLFVPDALSNSGVRSGSGLAMDPFVISDWRITVQNDTTAVIIENVQSHLRIERLEIFDPDAASAKYTIAIQNAPHVTIEEVVVNGGWTAMYLNNAAATISGFRAVNPVSADIHELHPTTALLAQNSNVTLRDLVGEGHAVGIFAVGSRMSILETRLATLNFGINIYGYAANDVTIQDVRIDQFGACEADKLRRTGSGVVLGIEEVKEASSLVIDGLEVQCKNAAVGLIPEGPWLANHVFEISELQANNTRIGLGVDAEGVTVRLKDSRITNSSIGIEVRAAGAISVDDSVFVDNEAEVSNLTPICIQFRNTVVVKDGIARTESGCYSETVRSPMPGVGAGLLLLLAFASFRRGAVSTKTSGAPGRGLPGGPVPRK